MIADPSQRGRVSGGRVQLDEIEGREAVEIVVQGPDSGIIFRGDSGDQQV